jgi:anti-sigma factor RsiW
MISCDEVFDLLSDGEVPADKKQEVDAHLVRCAQCRREAAGLDDFEDALRHPEDHEPSPPHVREAILAAVAARRTRRKLLALGLLLLIAGALAVGGVLFARTRLQPRSDDRIELGK